MVLVIFAFQNTAWP